MKIRFNLEFRFYTVLYDLLRVAYKLETQNWQARSKEDKEIVKCRKKVYL